MWVIASAQDDLLRALSLEISRCEAQLGPAQAAELKRMQRAVSGLPVTLDDERFAEGLRFLTRRDLRLARIVKELGAPPLWGRRPGFVTLVHSIVGQQVWLA